MDNQDSLLTRDGNPTKIRPVLICDGIRHVCGIIQRVRDKMKFDYYYGEESEQYSFLKIPKLFFTEEIYEGLSLQAKLLYGLMLDRMALSAQRGWYDDYNRAYVKYTSKAVAADMGINQKSALKYIKELSDFGLIIKVQQAGLADIIYVMNFTKIRQAAVPPDIQKSDSILQESEAESINTESPGKMGMCRDESGGSVKKLPDMDLTGNPANETTVKFTPLQNLQCSKIYTTPNFTPLQNLHTPEHKNNKNNYNNINTNQSIYQSYQSKGQTDMTEEYYEQLVKENIEYDIYIRDADKKSWYDEYYSIILEVIMRKADKSYIAGNEWSQNFVRARFLKITSSDMFYVHDRMQHTVSDIKNIKAYLIAALFNAPTTNKAYWQSRVNHDMYSDSHSD